jgi:phosphoribosylformylglycinamidine synthase
LRKLLSVTPNHLNELLAPNLKQLRFNELTKEKQMGKIVVDVMLKPEILDPQGKAVAAALPRLGFSFATDVRQGKRFEITVDGDVTAAQIAEVEKAAEVLLANPVIETFTVRAE